MTSETTINAEEFYTEISNAADEHQMFEIFLSDASPIGLGSTIDWFGKTIKIEIGTKPLNPDRPLTYGDLTIVLVSLHHEIGHARQVEYIFKEKSDLSTVLALNHYARKCSSAYYDAINLDKGNYSKHPSEIAAQYYGLKMTYRYLAKNIDPESANTLICDYVNNEVTSNFIPIDKNNPYTNVDDIFTKYNEVFNETVYKHREFNPNKQTQKDIYG